MRWLTPSGGVYVGVGPEQNFSYIAGLRPAMAFIVDIRVENRNLHLLYKVLFELSADRPDFVSRLFSRPRPTDLSSSASVQDIFARYETVPASPELYDVTSKLVRERLLASHHLPLTEADLDQINQAFNAFYTGGPAIDFWGSRAVDVVRPSFKLLMTATDTTGVSRSFLSSDQAYQFVKDLQTRNLIVPVVGDFGGPTAIRRVGDYVRTHGERVSAFYGSNVGVYLDKTQAARFCENLKTLPTAARAWFIENTAMQTVTARLKACTP